ncbi:MAG: hypothetical protein SF172_11855 [Burkholderiales bacterium]|nr:hypothetical protein [Burkholderiales bacterium]
MKPALLCLTAVTLLSGCAAVANRPTDESRWCYQQAKRKLCTSGPVPSLKADAEAKTFQPAAERQRVYIYRDNFWDADGIAIVSIGDTEFRLLPHSFVLADLPKGAYALRVRSSSQQSARVVDVAPGDLGFVEVHQTWHPLDIEFSARNVEPKTAVQRVSRSRLIGMAKTGASSQTPAAPR